MSAILIDLLIAVTGALIAVELWGWTEPLARLVIRAATWPLDEPWQDVRRQEFAALVEPCAGERRLTALGRLTTVVLRLAVHDVAAGRLRAVRGRVLATWLARALIAFVSACGVVLLDLSYLLVLLIFPAMVTGDILVWLSCDLQTCVIVTLAVVLLTPVFGFTTFVTCAMLPAVLREQSFKSRDG